MKILPYIGLLLEQLIFIAVACALEYKPQIAEVMGIIDGDAFRIRFPGNEESPQTEYVANLIGVDAPGFGEVECQARFVASTPKSENLLWREP